MLESGGHGLTGDLGIVAQLGFGGRDVADGFEQAPMVEPIHHSSVANSTASAWRQGPRRRITSVLKSPITVSARALS